MAFPSGMASAQSDLLAIPKHSGWVVDQASVLDGVTRNRLHSALENFHRSLGPQIQVLTVASTGIEPIDDYAVRVFDDWKIGDKDRRDGVLLLIAHKDRKLWISVGAGVEGELPDLLAKRIIEDAIVPFFKQGRFARGIENGVNAIGVALTGKSVTRAPVRRARRHRGTSFDDLSLSTLISFVILFLLLRTLMARLGFRSRRGGSVFILGGGSGGFGGGFGGGGFSGGGGGFTSGGGAGGSW